MTLLLASGLGPKTGTPVSGAKFAPIESLRGVAALGVLVHHVALFPPPHFIGPNWANTLADALSYGVSLFFVISAFTLMHSWHSRRSETSSLIPFYLRRLFRIAPLYFVWLAGRLVVDFSAGTIHSNEEIALSASFLFNFFPGHETGIVWNSWTIGLEVFFYLVFPLLAAFTTSFTRAICLLGASLAAWLLLKTGLAHLQSVDPIYGSFYRFSIFRHLPAFMMGIVTYHFYERYAHRLQNPAKWGSVFLLIAACLESSIFVIDHGKYPDCALIVLTLACASLLIGLLFFPIRMLVNRALGFCGQCSYSIYLNHAAVIFLLIPWYQRFYDAGGYRFYKFVACCAATTLIALALSWLTYRMIEIPGIELGRRIIARTKTS